MRSPLSTSVLAMSVIAVLGGWAHALESPGEAGDGPDSLCHEISKGDLPALVIPVTDEKFQTRYFCPRTDDQTGAKKRISPNDPPSVFENGTGLKIVLVDINPLTQRCDVGFTDTPVAEPSAESLAGIFGIPLPSAQSPKEKQNTPAPVKPKPSAALPRNPEFREETTSHAAANQCISEFNSQVKKVQDLFEAVSYFNDTVMKSAVDAAKTDIQAYNNLANEVEDFASAKGSDSLNKLTDIRARARGLQDIPLTTPVMRPDLGADPPPLIKSLEGKSLNDVAKALKNAAIELHGTLDAGAECGGDAEIAAESKKDNAFLVSVFSDEDGNPSYESVWLQQNAAITQMASQLADAKGDLIKKLSNPGPATRTFLVPDRHQSDDVIKVSCTKTPLNLAHIAIKEGNPGKSNAQDATTKDSGGKDQPAAKPDTQTATFKIRFGHGPRVFESAGMVLSPLQQHSFVTAAAGSGPSCPNTANGQGTAPTGCIVDQTNSDWRILPMVVVSFRLGEHGGKAIEWIPYASLGATVKSSSTSGTSLELLLGPSWALAHRHLFLTGGGYAGQVTDLGGGLVKGAQYATMPSTIPTVNGYKWGYGFAVSFKLGAQGGSAPATPKDDSGGSPKQ